MRRENLKSELNFFKDGRIDYGEFVAMMKKGIIGNGRLTMRHTSDGSILHGAGGDVS
jgi:calcium-dependent protein kinase